MNCMEPKLSEDLVDAIERVRTHQFADDTAIRLLGIMVAEADGPGAIEIFKRVMNYYIAYKRPPGDPRRHKDYDKWPIMKRSPAEHFQHLRTAASLGDPKSITTHSRVAALLVALESGSSSNPRTFLGFHKFVTAYNERKIGKGWRASHHRGLA